MSLALLLPTSGFLVYLAFIHPYSCAITACFGPTRTPIFANKGYRPALPALNLCLWLRFLPRLSVGARPVVVVGNAIVNVIEGGEGVYTLPLPMP